MLGHRPHDKRDDQRPGHRHSARDDTVANVLPASIPATRQIAKTSSEIGGQAAGHGTMLNPNADAEVDDGSTT